LVLGNLEASARCAQRPVAPHAQEAAGPRALL